MGKIANHQSAETTKLLLIGIPGSGKTGALASLAHVGYNVRILDLDNGADIIRNLLLHPTSPYDKGAAERVNCVTLTEDMKNQGGRLVPKSAKVWPAITKQLDNWVEYESRKKEDGTIEKVETDNFGPISSWTPKDILVIDSLTFLAKAAFRYIRSLNARLTTPPHQSDYGDAQNYVEELLSMLYSNEVRCNVVICCHVQFLNEENAPPLGVPMTIGKALSPKVGSYFNNTLRIKTTGSGTNIKRKLMTLSSDGIELKSSAPLSVKAEYDIRFGLAEYFADLRGG